MKAKSSFDPRKLMEKAVEVMKASVRERRVDDTITPKVGAVLWKPDGTIETACRGELREGDHAEYTLLERKNGHENLSECVLFSTLEPCGPDSRNPPKVGCARRIANALVHRDYEIAVSSVMWCPLAMHARENTGSRSMSSASPNSDTDPDVMSGFSMISPGFTVSGHKSGHRVRIQPPSRHFSRQNGGHAGNSRSICATGASSSTTRRSASAT